MSDEFDLCSEDEADFAAATLEPSTSHVSKRGIENDAADVSATKRIKIGHGLNIGRSPSKILANKVLKERFGLDGFRLEQEAAITRVLDGGSAVVVFPTGGGKSLCYQVSDLTHLFNPDP